MKTFAIELDDRAVSFSRDGRVLASTPSAVSDGSTGEPAGANAWQALRLQPTATSTRHLGSVLSEPVPSDRAVTLVTAELTRRLAEHAPEAGERVWIAAPARADARGLGTVLGILRAQSVPVDGFVDSAAVCVAALGLERSAVVLEIGLHHAAATSVERDGGQVRRRRAVRVDRGGLLGLYQAWLDFISTAMVKRTRFDPLHHAATEQQLFDSLATLATEAALSGSATAALTRGGERFEVTLSRDEFVQAGQPVYREIVRLFHELRPAGAAVAFVVPVSIAQLPGLRDELEQFVGCELVSLPDGFAAAASSLFGLPEHGADDPVHLLRRVPSNAQPALADRVSREPLGQRRAGGPPPSHVLWEGQAYSLGADPLVIGRAPGDGRAVRLPDGLAGVSRRHCTLLRDGEQLVLLDHSSFGTFVNGERVAERVRVYPGDRVRLGEPGVELVLISVGDAARPPASGAPA